MMSKVIPFVGYFLIILWIIWLATRNRSETTEDFFLGGRKMNEWVVALSAVASGRSAWLLLGLTGIAYKIGVSAVWAVVGYIWVEMCMFSYLGKRLRKFTSQRRIITIPEFFAERFGDRRHILRLLSTFIIILFFFVYISAQLIAGGKTFSGSFGVSLEVGIGITALIVLLYTTVGGFAAVAWTDVLQACMMLVALLVLPIIAVASQGGLGQIFASLKDAPMEVFKSAGSAVDFWALGAGGVIGLIAIGLGSPGNPHILVRYMSIDEPKALRKAAIIGTIWNILTACGAILVGLAARTLIPYPDIPLKASGAADYDKVFLLMANVYLPSVLQGLVLAAIFAAIMSTIDSQLLVVSSSVTRDLYQKLFSKDASEKTMLVLGRVSVVLIVILAVLAGLYINESIFWLVLLAWGGLGSALGPVVILSLYWRGMTWAGAVAGILVGTVTVWIWKYTPWLHKAFIKYELVPGFLFATFAIVVVSLLTRPIHPPEKAFEDLLDVPHEKS